MKKMSSVFGIILLAATVAFAQDAPKPAPPAPAPQMQTQAPPPERVTTIKLTNKLLKQQEKIQAKLNKVQTELTIQQNKQKIFQIEAQAAITASNSK